MLVKSLIPYFSYFLAIQKCHKESNYTIHGLWIDYERGGYPAFCNRTNFNVSELNDLRKDLDSYWPSCYGKSEGLWEHEWQKHGTCFNTNMTLHLYFEKTLELYKNKINDVQSCHKKECLIPVDFIELDSN